MKEKILPKKYRNIIGIMIFLSILIYCILLIPINYEGEISSYVCTMIAVENHFSDIVTLEDIEDAKNDFPELENNITSKRLFCIDLENNLYKGYYSAIYSLFVLPIKKIFSFCGIVTTYAFYITNLLTLFSAALFGAYALKKRKILTFLILFFNPICFSICRISAEVFIYSMILCSNVFFIKKKYKISIAFSILAASMNLAVILWSVLIILAYFLEKFIESEPKGLLNKLKFVLTKNISEIIFLVLILIMGVLNYTSGVSEKFLGDNISFNNILEIFNRAVAYLFDMNIGIIMYYGPFFVLFCYCFIKLIKEKNINVLFLCVAFFAVLFGYSLKDHMHSACAGIARYNAWNSAFMIIVVLQTMNLKCNSKRFCAYVTVSIFFVISIVVAYGGYNNKENYLEFSVFSKLVLNNVPHLYFGHENLFITRCRKFDEKRIILVEPAIYTNTYGYVTKVVLKPEHIENLDKYLIIEESKLEKIKQKYNSSTKRYIWLTFLPNEKVLKEAINVE